MKEETTGLFSFNIVHRCSRIIEIHHEHQIPQLIKKYSDALIVGGGSNILLVNDIPRPILLIRNEGIKIVNEGKNYVDLALQAGTIWQNVVEWSVQRNLGGIENLSLIPGRCGAAPIQNIGAYGAEIKDVLQKVRFYHIEDQEWVEFDNTACQFEYRDSIFKNDLKDQVVISEIILRLHKAQGYRINTSYGAIKETLQHSGVTEPNIADVSRAVIAIRRSKLPDPAQYPNAGSFFKNPIIPLSQYNDMVDRYQKEIPCYPVDKAQVKVPAGWLIDQCGWKGKKIGHVGTYPHQALVIVNYGTSDGADILAFMKLLQDDVYSYWGVRLEPEVNIVTQ